MPNAEYLRLKQLLVDNPQYVVMLDAISKAEGTWGKDAYSTKYRNAKIDWRKGKDESVIDGSSAHGKYQFLNETWKSLKNQLGLTGFSPEEQDIAALKLLEEKKALKHIDNGDMRKAIFAASDVWSSFPKNDKGESAHMFKGKPQKAKSLNTVLGYTKSNEAERAEVNNKYKDANLNYVSKDIKKEKETYLKELRIINAKKDLSPAQKEAEKHEVKKRYYREGKLMAINSSIVEDNKKVEERKQKIKDLQLLAQEYNELNPEVKKSDYAEEAQLGKGLGSLLKSTNNVTTATSAPLAIASLFSETFGAAAGSAVGKISGSKKNKADEKILNLAKELGIKLKYKTPLVGYKTDDNSIANIDIDALKKDISNQTTTLANIPVERGVLKYGEDKTEFDAKKQKDFPQDTGISADIENGTAETAEEKAKRLAEEKAIKDAADKALAEKMKQPNFDALSHFDEPDMYVDTQFEYTPGKQKIPFDALIGLTTGLVGMAEADDIEIKYREDQISEGMLQYAQDLARIKNIGLDPAIEGDLKMKLASAYQTGLTNIVRASNGNRNLVLGNQGQLDMTRMNGIVEMTAMDIDRSDKAMVAFGEVQKYIQEFEEKKAIYNSDRRYKEDVVERAAAADLASQGMSNFIDAIQHAKENAPGSMNDMRRQYFQFAATGILPGAKAGEPGSIEYKEAMTLKHNAQKDKKKQASDFKNSLNLEEQDILNNLLVKFPNMDPLKNENASIDDLKELYNKESGNDEFKSLFFKEKKVSTLDQNKTKTIADEAKDEPEPIVVDKPYISTSTGQTEIEKQVKPGRYDKSNSFSDLIVTKESLPSSILQKDMAKSLNGFPSGVNAWSQKDVNVQNSNETILQMNEDFQSLMERKQYEIEHR